MEIDVIILTYNCIRGWPGKEIFSRCLFSVSENVPINRLIIVDGGSSDNTLEFIKELNDRYGLFPELVFINDNGGNRATARMKGIKAVETEWFAFIDTDCILCNEWFKRAFKHVKNHIGAIEGAQRLVLNAKDKRFLNARKELKRRFKRLVKNHIVIIKKGRGFTGDTIIQTDLVKDIKIPKYYHVLEDYYIKKHVESKGFKWIKVNDAYCYHYVHYHKPRDVYYSAFILAREGKLTLKRALLSILTSFLKYTIIGYPDCGLREFKLSLYRLSGVFKEIIS